MSFRPHLRCYLHRKNDKEVSFSIIVFLKRIRGVTGLDFLLICLMIEDLIDGEGERRKGLKQMQPIAGNEIGFFLWLT